MVDLDTLSIGLTGIGLIIAITYYSLQIRNQNKTRQAQLFMQLYNAYRSKELIEQTSVTYNMTYEDAADFDSKYGELSTRLPYTQTSYFFEGVGVLVEEGLIDIDLVAKLMAGDISGHWRRFGPYVLERREIVGHPEYMEYVEYLFNEVVKVKPEQSQVKQALETPGKFYSWKANKQE